MGWKTSVRGMCQSARAWIRTMSGVSEMCARRIEYGVSFETTGPGGLVKNERSWEGEAFGRNERRNELNIPEEMRLR